MDHCGKLQYYTPPPPSYMLNQKKHSYKLPNNLPSLTKNNNHITIQDRVYSSSNYNLRFTVSYEPDL